jgi:hypothetical protein
MGAGTLAGCAGKQSFTSWRLAHRAAERIARRQPNHPMNVYRCGICGAYHCGTIGEDQRARARDWKRKKRQFREIEE